MFLTHFWHITSAMNYNKMDSCHYRKLLLIMQ